MKELRNKYPIEEHFTHMKIEFICALILLISFSFDLWGLAIYIPIRFVIDFYLIDKYLKIKKIPYYFSFLYLLVGIIFFKALTLLWLHL